MLSIIPRRFSRYAWQRLAMLGLAIFWMTSLATPVLADCCRCVSANEPDKNICLTVSSGGCATIKTTYSSNPNLVGLNCEEVGLKPAQCQLISQNAQGGAICQVMDNAQTYGLDQSVSSTVSQPETLVPTLNVPIPGLQFASGLPTVSGKIQSPFLAQYISAIYSYALGITVLAAAVMIIYGGLKYLVGSSIASISGGKEIIINAIIGLFLMFGAWTLLGSLNPATITPKTLDVQIVQKVPDEAWFNTNGTADPFLSASAFQKAKDDPIPGGVPAASQGPSGPKIPGLPGEPSLPGAPPAAPPFSGETVDISSIPFDKSLGGPANMNSYCTPISEASKATTYEQKVKLLAKAVLGWSKTCVDNKLCVYCQTCFTAIPTGVISGTPDPVYAVKKFTDAGIASATPEALWSTPETIECLNAYRGYGDWAKKTSIFGLAYVRNTPACSEPVTEAYKKSYIDTFTENKLFGGDCGSFVQRLYRCANANFQPTPTEMGYNPVLKKKVASPYMSAASIGKFDNQPVSVLSAHMDADLEALAAKKGGMKFGDLIYICCGGSSGSYSAHWVMYTGGRPDVPFNFIEMGGQGAVGPNLPGIGQQSGVKTDAVHKTLTDYIKSKTTGTPFYSKSGKLLWTSPASYDAHTGAVFVWRPYAD